MYFVQCLVQLKFQSFTNMVKMKKQYKHGFVFSRSIQHLTEALSGDVQQTMKAHYIGNYERYT